MYSKAVVVVLIFALFVNSMPALAHASVASEVLFDVESTLINFKNRLAVTPAGSLLGLNITVPRLQPLEGRDNPVTAYGAASVSDYDVSMMFIDVAKIMRPWIGHHPGKWGGMNYQDLKGGGYLDEKGWVKKIPSEVTSVAGIFAWSDQYGSDKSRAGRYVLTYEGEGTIDVSLISRSQIISREPGKIVFTIKPNQGNWMVSISKTDPNNTGNYIRNISIVKEDMIPLLQAGALFNPDYLNVVKDARIIRFMGTMGANNSKKSKWSEEIVGINDIYSYSAGVPLEVLVRLANEAGIDPWFNLPFLADDEYVRKFGDYIKQNLDPKLVAYVELSNEVWNWSFQQANQSHSAGIKEWKLDPKNGGAAWVNYMGKRSYEVMKILTEVYGSRADTNLRRVAPTQSVSTWVSEQVLLAPMWKQHDPTNYVPPHTMFDVLSPTTYFGGDLIKSQKLRNEMLALLATGDNGYNFHRDLLQKPVVGRGKINIQAVPNGTQTVRGVGTVFTEDAPKGSLIDINGTLYSVWEVVSNTELRLSTPYTGTAVVDAPVHRYANDSVKRTLMDLKLQKALADKFNLQLIPYEGGQHVQHAFAINVPEKEMQALQEHLTGFVRSPQMADLYKELWDGWKSLGTGPFMIFTEVGAPSKYGSWGMLASLHDDNPRAQLLKRLESSEQIWWTEKGGEHYQQGKIIRAAGGATTLAGTAAEDYLVGSPQDDVLYPGPGNDGVNGGAGTDILILKGKESDYTITDKGVGKQVVGPDGKDYVYGVETFTFSEGKPVPVDTPPTETATTSTSFRVVAGQQTYQAVPAVSGAGVSIHAINGMSATANELRGQSKGNTIYSIHHGRAQATIDGKSHRVNYWLINENRIERIGKSIGSDAVSTALRFGDLVVGPVAITGTDFADDMRGRNMDDVFYGAGGADLISGDGGNDVLGGGLGNDDIDGGRGLDVLELAGPLSAYSFIKKSRGVEVSGPEGVDTVRNVERVRFVDTNATYDLIDMLTKSDSNQTVVDSTDPVTPAPVVDTPKSFTVIKDVLDYQAAPLYGEGVMVYAINRWATLGKQLGISTTLPAYHIYTNNTQVTYNGNTLRPNYWNTHENKSYETSTEPISASALDTALLFGNIIVSPALIRGTEYEDDMRGREFNDRFEAGKGNDIVLGGEGEDTLYLSGTRNDYRVLVVKDWHSHLVIGPDGSDKVSGIEFLHFNGNGERVPLVDLVVTNSSSNVLGASNLNGIESVTSMIDYGAFVEFR